MGDPLAIGPVIKSETAKLKNLGQSLMDRLYYQGVEVIELTTSFNLAKGIDDLIIKDFWNYLIDTE